jgi:hypothetical protein
MLFVDIPEGKRFKHKNEEYLRIRDVKVSCCKITANAIRLTDNEQVLFKHKTEIGDIDD